MNGRIHIEQTPAGRLAAVAMSVRLQVARAYWKSGGRRDPPPEPDYADLVKVLAPFVKREELIVRIDQARKSGGQAITDEVKELAAQLEKVERDLPDVFDL